MNILLHAGPIALGLRASDAKSFKASDLLGSGVAETADSAPPPLAWPSSFVMMTFGAQRKRESDFKAFGKVGAPGM